MVEKSSEEIFIDLCIIKDKKGISTLLQDYFPRISLITKQLKDWSESGEHVMVTFLYDLSCEKCHEEGYDYWLSALPIVLEGYSKNNKNTQYFKNFILNNKNRLNSYLVEENTHLFIKPVFFQIFLELMKNKELYFEYIPDTIWGIVNKSYLEYGTEPLKIIKQECPEHYNFILQKFCYAKTDNQNTILLKDMVEELSLTQLNYVLLKTQDKRFLEELNKRGEQVYFDDIYLDAICSDLTSNNINKLRIVGELTSLLDKNNREIDGLLLKACELEVVYVLRYLLEEKNLAASSDLKIMLEQSENNSIKEIHRFVKARDLQQKLDSSLPSKSNHKKLKV